MTQRKLASQIAQQACLPTLALEHSDGVVFGAGDLVKMFVPSSKRLLGGSAQDRMVTGAILIVPRGHLQPLSVRSRRHRIVGAFRSIHIANFPSIILLSEITENGVTEPFLAFLTAMADALPSDETGWSERFGKSFSEDWEADSSRAAIEYLRKDSRFALKRETTGPGVEISIVFEPPLEPSP